MPNCNANRESLLVNEKEYKIYILKELCECEHYRDSELGLHYCILDNRPFLKRYFGSDEQGR